ncbi:hypothetical protein I4U23_015907 [Adineta vaga]|nr:hypothetical protein I4U23_015907 [Adineta vaga]
MAAQSFTTSPVMWMWKINKNDLWYFPKQNEIEDDNWHSYSDVETANIETSFRNKKQAAIFNDYRIDFVHFMHISNWNDKRERLVKRIPCATGLSTKKATQPENERFLPTPLLPMKSFAQWREDDIGCFLYDVSNHFNIHASSLQDPCIRRSLVEKAAIGLTSEGIDKKGETIVKELLSMKDGTLEQVTAKCAALYTSDSFVYRKLNEFMRLDGDKEKSKFLSTKVETLGPFALLLSAIPENRSEEKMTVYRSVLLDEDMIDRYRELEGGKDFVFPAFTSTSRNQEIADIYDGNMILKIDIIPRYDAVDVSSYSKFPEEEMLLNAYFSFSIQSCTYDIVKERWIIHLQSSSIDKE